LLARSGRITLEFLFFSVGVSPAVFYAKKKTLDFFLHAEQMIRCFLILTIQYLSLRDCDLVGFGGRGEFNMF